jgi:hypothetical protein
VPVDVVGLPSNGDGRTPGKVAVGSLVGGSKVRGDPDDNPIFRFRKDIGTFCERSDEEECVNG